MVTSNTYTVPVSQKGQITIPIKIREKLGLDKQKKVIIKFVSDQKAIIKAPKYSLDEVFGAVKPINKSFSEQRKIAREERLENAG